jgi:NADPH2:quinone reductase
MLQGMTAHYLVTSVFDLRKGHTALVPAAAGGVGGLLVQIAKHRGARVIATASRAKLDEVKALGADEVLDYDDPWPEGMNVVYDGVGKTTFDRSLDALAVRGTLALYGQSSGPVPPVDPARLAKRSNFLTRPSLGHYIAARDGALARAGAVRVARVGRGEAAHRPRDPAARRGGGTSRAGEPHDEGEVVTDAVIELCNFCQRGAHRRRTTQIA